MEKYFGKLIEDYEKILSEEVGEGKLKTRLVDELKSVFNVHIKYAILKNYEANLNQELGDGDLKKRIKSKLEGILNGKTSQDLLDKPFDYESIIEQNHNLAVRIRNCLKSQDIKTYSDLARNCYDFYLSGRRPWKNEEIYFHYLQHIRNLGRKSAQIITSHLSKINFDFSKEFAEKNES